MVKERRMSLYLLWWGAIFLLLGGEVSSQQVTQNCPSHGEILPCKCTVKKVSRAKLFSFSPPNPPSPHFHKFLFLFFFPDGFGHIVRIHGSESYSKSHGSIKRKTLVYGYLLFKTTSQHDA